MKNIRVTAVLAIFAFAAIAAAQGQQTPEQREAAARARYDKDAATPRPIAAADSVWIEELTYLEVRDAMKAGKTTALIVTGSTSVPMKSFHPSMSIVRTGDSRSAHSRDQP